MNIKEAVESFINFRRSIGRKDESKTYTLRLFANFWEKLQKFLQ